MQGRLLAGTDKFRSESPSVRFAGACLNLHRWELADIDISQSTMSVMERSPQLDSANLLTARRWVARALQLPQRRRHRQACSTHGGEQAADEADRQRPLDACPQQFRGHAKLEHDLAEVATHRGCGVTVEDQP